jgi:hypothetical protein
MATSRQAWRRGDGSAVVRGWVELYTVGLPPEMQARRRGEVAGDLADENQDAIRRGELGELRRRRLIRLALGIPADLAWRFLEAPSVARRIRARLPQVAWVPLSRWSLVMITIVTIGSAGGLAIVTVPYLTGQMTASTWPGWGPVGFSLGCTAVLVGGLLSVPWPRRGVAVTIPGALVGLLAAPWLWGCWFLPLVAVLLRVYQADKDAWPRRTTGPGSAT